MPYTQATILEILRHASVISPGERLAVKDNVIDGTFYPKVITYRAWQDGYKKVTRFSA